jgi:Na+-transporting methylmalonyl-CoA/oxaloacetate decarboxylase beta subunit
VLGPLPKLYRLVVAVAALLVFVGVGAWAAFLLAYPVLISVGASIGLGLGTVCAYLLLHQPSSTT